MKHIRLLIGLLLFAALVSFARAEDAAPEATPEVTDAVIVATEAPAAVTEAPAPAPEELSPVANAYREAVTWIGATLITVLVVLVGVIGGLIKTNATIAKYAAENVPQSYFDKANVGTDYAEGLAKTLTPNWQGDDKVVAELKKQLAELRAAIYPQSVTITANKVDTSYLQKTTTDGETTG